MKKLLLILLCLPFIGFGQSVPQGINYQAVVRDTSGAVLMNQALTIQFSVISDISTGNVSWQETHTVSTNDYGLYIAIIGQGTSTSGGSSATFDVIDWGASNHLLKVEVDYGGGFVDMGTSAFMSTPYTLYSENTNNQTVDSLNLLINNFLNKKNIGDIYQGGVVFYVDYTGLHGLIAAFNDINPSSWGCYGTYITGTHDTLLTGQYNSNLILNQSCGGLSAAQKCDVWFDVYNGGVYEDWYLPSIDELVLMHQNLYSLALTMPELSPFYGYYWSSTEISSIMAYRKHTLAGAATGNLKTTSHNVRPIRAF